MEDFLKNYGKGCFTLIGLAVILVLVWAGLTSWFLLHVDAGYTGVVITYGIGSRPTAINVPSNNYVWMNSFAGQLFIEYPSSQQTLAMVANSTEGEFQGDDSVPCQDISGIQIKRDITLNWQVDDAAKLYLLRRISTLSGNANNDVESLVVRQAVKSAVQTACSQFSWDQMSAKTQQVGSIIEGILTPELAAEGITVNAVYPGEVHYNAQQEAALNANAVAQQQAAQAQYDKQKADYEAQAAIAQAQGQAQAIAILEAQLGKSPQYIQYLEIKEWDGHLPQYLSTNGNTNPVTVPFSGK